MQAHHGGAALHGGDRPFPDVAMDFTYGYRFGIPFFLPIAYYDTRTQLRSCRKTSNPRHHSCAWN